MKLELKLQNLTLPYLVEKLIQRKLHKLEKMLHAYEPLSLALLAEVSQQQNNEQFAVALSLQIPGAELRAHKSDMTIIGACGEAFKALFSSVEEYKGVLRNRSEQKNGRVQDGRNLKVVNRDLLMGLFHKNYHRFYNYALREIRFRCYQGFSKPGDITVKDILDDVLVQVADRMLSRFDERRALRIIYDEIRKMIDGQLRPPGTGMVPLEQTIEPEDIDRRYEEYYQPDEMIKVEDIVIDENAEIPEQKIEYQEIEIYIDRVLSQLPADWREAFILIEREGISAEELAKNRNRSVESVLHDLEMTKIFLREKLGDAGFAWTKNAAHPASSRA